jgi:hypothetical protein
MVPRRQEPPAGASGRRATSSDDTGHHTWGADCGSNAENIFIVEDNYSYSVKILRVEKRFHDDGLVLQSHFVIL